jgi:hypothetical protein
MDGRGARFLYVDLLDLSARAHYALGESERAFEQMQQAYALAKSSTVRRKLWEVAAALSEWERARGDLEAAQAYANEARTTVEFIAAHTPPEFRTSFLNQPAVRQLWDRVPV